MTTKALATAWLRLLVLTMLFAPYVVLAEESSPRRLQVSGLVESQLHFSSGEESWLRRGAGKFRYDDNDEGNPQLSQVGLDLRYAFNLQSQLKLAAHYYPDPGDNVEITEAYWQYRTLPAGHWRSRYRVGAFYPEFSYENSGKLWTSPYTLSSSFINAWIGAEIRTLGIEGKWTWSGENRAGSDQRVSLVAALFGFNDPLGAIISWHGWAAHDQQLGIDGTLPARELPILVPRPGRPVLSEDFEPFKEIDDRPGYYLGVEWEPSRNLKAQAVYYDNLTDDTMIEDGQYGWRTRFYQLAMHWQLPADYEILGQFLHGNTTMKKDVVDNDFDSAYLMLVKTRDRHRVALRIEYGDVTDLDGRRFDYNDEETDSVTLSYSYLFPKGWKLSMEATRQQSDRKNRLYFDEPTDLTEKQLLLSARYYF